jgi:transcriptional regulator NrdR family protein
MNDCPHEFGPVINTRKRGEYVYRRRKCPECGENFTTIEMAVEGDNSTGFAAGELATKIKNLSTENRHLMTQLVDRLTSSN